MTNTRSGPVCTAAAILGILNFSRVLTKAVALAFALGSGVEVAVAVPGEGKVIDVMPPEDPGTAVACAIDDSEELEETDLIPKMPPNTPPKIAAISAATITIRIQGLKPQIFRFVFASKSSGGASSWYGLEDCMCGSVKGLSCLVAGEWKV